MDREHLITEGESSPTSSFLDGSPSPTISAFEIRFNKHRMNETKVEPLDLDSSQRKVPLPFQKRDKIRSSMEFDKVRKIDHHVTPSKDFRPNKPTKLAPMPSPSSTISSSDTDTKPLDNNTFSNHFGSVSSKKSSAIPFDEIVIPTVYKRMKMNGEVFGDESGEDRMALADIWYGQTQSTPHKEKVGDCTNLEEGILKKATTSNHHSDLRHESTSNDPMFTGDLGNHDFTVNHQPHQEYRSDIHNTGSSYTNSNSYAVELNRREKQVNRNQREVFPVDPQAIHLKNLRETMGSEKHTSSVGQTNSLSYGAGNIVKETVPHRTESEPPQKASSGCCVIL